MSTLILVSHCLAHRASYSHALARRSGSGRSTDYGTLRTGEESPKGQNKGAGEKSARGKKKGVEKGGEDGTTGFDFESDFPSLDSKQGSGKLTIKKIVGR